MKNVNYNLVKLLRNAMSDAYNIENFYLKDAKEEKCHSEKALEQILEDRKRHVEMLKEEIKMRMDNNKFN